MDPYERACDLLASMRAMTIGLAVALAFIGAACAEPEPETETETETEELQTFMCGSWECEQPAEYCWFAVPCEGVIPSEPTCMAVPEECDGVASLDCLGPVCQQAEDGSISCRPACPGD
jgi:hypothetical protein